MADKKYKINFELSNGTTKSVKFTAPQGEKGDPGYTPVKGTDYWTPDDQASIQNDCNTYIANELAKRGQLTPEFANSIAECTDTSKLYVLPDGYIYGYLSSALLIRIETREGGYYNSKGEFVAGANGDETAQRTNLFPCKEGDQFTVTSSAKYNASVIWFGESENILATETYGGAGMSPETATVTAPSGAAYVRFYSYSYVKSGSALCLAVTPLQESYAWASTGHAFVPADYEYRIVALEEKTDDLANGVTDPLYGKKIVYDGDSICYGAGSSGGYAKIIAELTGGSYVNQAVGGGRLVTKGSNSWHSVVDNLPNLPTDGDIYCFEGGINDYWTSGMQLGTFDHKNFDGALDTTTVCGALEAIFRYALTNFVGKPICFVITHKVQSTAYTKNANGDTFEDYRNAMVGICEKYSIPYYDAFAESGLNGWNATQNEAFFTDGDGCHPNEDGYKRYYVPQLLELFREIIPQTGAKSILYFDAIKEYLDNFVAGLAVQEAVINYDLNVKAVNHRGFSTEAPENTIPAYILSKKKGFTYVECDVSFTKDGVAVLLHDGTIDRTSDGTGSISDLNYVDAYQYDFGSWKSEAYAGTKIPTFKEFVILCRNLGLHPYIELKSNGSYTKEQIHSLVDMVEACGMKGKVTWISFSATFLAYVRDYDSTARLGYVCSLTSAAIGVARNLRTGENDVFLDCSYSTVTDVSECVDADIPVEVWTVNSVGAIKNLNPYVSGVTSDNLVAGKILHDASMTYVAPEPDLSAISISLSASALSFTSKESQTITTTVLPVGCTDAVVWESSNEDVATVENGVVMPVGNGSAIIKATAGSVSAECAVEVTSIRTLLYSWDFTNSMTDTVSSLTPTLQNNATQDANGLSIPAANSYANFGAIAKRGMTFELDIAASSVLNTGTAHGRLLCFSGNNASMDDGVLWRGGNFNYWGTYLSSGWGKGQLSTDPNVFSGKTMTTSINEDGTVTVYAGNELLVKTDDVVDFESGGYVTVGSSSIAAVGVTITAMRIYDGETYIPQTKPDDWVNDAIVLTADDFIAKGIAFSSDTGAYYPYLMGRTDRISFVGYNVTLDPGYEYTVTCESTTGAIGKLAVRQVPSWYDIKAKVHISESHDSGWKDSGYKFAQQNSYECAWITLAAANTTDAISLDDLTSVTITRSKS
jgi:glycerophosphoryl diester phosphodiesterase